MMGATHMTAGVLVGYTVGQLAGLPLPETGVLAVVGAVAALLPDLDHPQSLIRQRTGFVGTLAGFWMRHRGITHTIPVAVLAGLIVALLGPPVLAVTVFAGYASHLLLDALTRSGVPLAWPLTWEPVRLLPGPLQVRTGGWREGLFMLLLMGLAVALGLHFMRA